MIRNAIMMDASLLHLIVMFWLALVMLLLFIIDVAIFVKFLKKKERKFLVAFIIISLIFFGALGLQFLLNHHYHYSLEHEELDYTIELDSSSEEYDLVYMPISSNIELQNDVYIVEGNGDIGIINTEYGMALSINFTGSVKIHGRIETTNGVWAHDLTMVNDPVGSLGEEYWIFYQPYDEGNYNCSFELELYHEAFDWWEWHNSEGYLRSGWNTYPFEGEAVS